MSINSSEQFWQNVTDSGINPETVFNIMHVEEAYAKAIHVMDPHDVYIAAMHAENALRFYYGVAGVDRFKPERTGLSNREINAILKSIWRAGYGACYVGTERPVKKYIEEMVKDCRRVLKIRIDLVALKKEQAEAKAKAKAKYGGIK